MFCYLYFFFNGTEVLHWLFLREQYITRAVSAHPNQELHPGFRWEVSFKTRHEGDDLRTTKKNNYIESDDNQALTCRIESPGCEY